MAPALNAALEPLFAALAERPACVCGTVAVRLTVGGASGAVEGLEYLTNTLIALPQGGWEDPAEAVAAVVEEVAAHLAAARFPAHEGGEPTFVTLPLCFA